MSAVKRAKQKCFVVGTPSTLSERVLPTASDMLRFILHVRYQNMPADGTKQNPSLNEVADVVAKQLEDLWCKASIPTMNLKKIKDKIKTLNREYMKIKANSPSRRDSSSVQSLVRQFQSEASKIFEIAACRYDSTSSQYCKCEAHKKVPS